VEDKNVTELTVLKEKRKKNEANVFKEEKGKEKRVAG